MSNSLAQYQARRFVGPDMDPNCLQRLSVDDTCMQSYLKCTTGDLHGQVTDHRSGHDTIRKRHTIQTVTRL